MVNHPQHKPVKFSNVDSYTDIFNFGRNHDFKYGEYTKYSKITHLRSAIFWDITQRLVVIHYQRFGTIYLSHFKDQ
jgi:hypothetical protein